MITMNYKIRAIKEDIQYIKEVLKEIEYYSKEASTHDEEERDEAKRELCEWCRDLMGSTCALYEDIEKRFGVDPYND